ncbi:hypothetical protein [Caballeronia sp. ATUFL_F2_KS9A]|nr:hypothetical protein [Caballeronia sp. ATUFL_F2_KS9A]
MKRSVGRRGGGGGGRPPPPPPPGAPAGPQYNRYFWPGPPPA